jgi:xylulokinase
MYLLGYDIGSSSVKANLLEVETGKTIASDFFPKQEMLIQALKPGWAEQDPEMWWKNLKMATQTVIKDIEPKLIKAIGISYQMHGLILIDKEKRILRPSIIWCDSRANSYGEQAFDEIGAEKCLTNLLNSPGNFTASKLAWVKENEPEIFEKTWKIMLPGDYIAMRLTGEARTTLSGLSEGILYNFKENKVADFLLSYFGFDNSIIPDIVTSFSEQGFLLKSVSKELGLPAGIPISYRAGDQPNNAFSLNVLYPGEIAATAGTSGVVYGISDQIKYDPESRVNTFAHVNHSSNLNRLGVLLCINGTGITYSWLKKIMNTDLSYDKLNDIAAKIKPGSEGLRILPFGNGSERVLGNQNPGCTMTGLQFNTHSEAHLIHAAQEGIAFSFQYGLEIMKTIGIQPKIIKAGNTNMFLSPLFREILSSISGATIELYNTDGSQGAARAAGFGAGIYKNIEESFKGLSIIDTIEPESREKYFDAYHHWKELINNTIN